MKTIQNNYNSSYEEILDKILTKADIENKEMWFMDVYDYLEKINKKELMPFLLKDLKKLGLEIVFSRVYTDYQDLTVSK
ncbi:MAG: hypothetical protein WC979_05930 [Candidatus Pacearchaeota archaeon]|jgi:hypothetical protein